MNKILVEIFNFSNILTHPFESSLLLLFINDVDFKFKIEIPTIPYPHNFCTILNYD